MTSKEHNVSNEMCCLTAQPVTHRKMLTQTGVINKHTKMGEKV